MGKELEEQEGRREMMLGIALDLLETAEVYLAHAGLEAASNQVHRLREKIKVHA